MEFWLFFSQKRLIGIEFRRIPAERSRESLGLQGYLVARLMLMYHLIPALLRWNGYILCGARFSNQGSYQAWEDSFMADDDKCEHDMCSCPVAGDTEYCSDHCKDAVDQDIVEISCDCGHAGCS